jgi:phospholipid/cholesterol/gamma-HCH transport system ATP-binding protein
MNRNEERNMDVELVEISHLDLEVGGIEIFSNTSFSIKKNRGYLITGPNEEANVLLLKIIGGIVPPQSIHPNQRGRVLFLGTDIYENRESEIRKIKKKIAFVFREGTMISNLTIRENMLLPFRFHWPDDNCVGALEKIKADFHFFAIPDVLDKRPDLVSYSLKKKLAYIRASLQEPELILVEKPMFNLDEEDCLQVLRYLENLKKTGMTFIIASRFQLILETLIDEAIVLEEGKMPNIISKTHKEFAILSRFITVRS